MNAGFGAVAAGRFFCLLFAFCIAGDLTLKGQAVIPRVDALPGLYGSFRSISSKDFNGPFQIGGSYFVSTDLVFIAGVSIDVDNDFPVYPAIGLHWKIGSKWVIEGIAPLPQLRYLLSDNVTLFAGADLRETTFRMAENFGQSSGIRKLDNAILQYREVRATAGLIWKLSKNLSVDIEGGCSLSAILLSASRRFQSVV